jgi:nucleotidyltransferase/DNA polymerase involved in DNA repair
MYVFNDAGVGKDGAGIAALGLLDADRIAAVAVAHTSARIGEALDTWERGVVSHLNAAARQLGLREGEPLREQLRGG